jgi:N-acetylglucosaminyldiphosphoundecaprenol N-acetyl-beta-D-mannosaminyltransferase
MCLITAVVPAKNRWDELAECLNALAQQENCPQWELVIIDDGSQVPIPSRLQQVVSSYKVPVRIRRQVPLGESAARNQGAYLANGELVLFIDSDSLPTKYCLASLAACAAKHPEDVAFQLKILGKPDTWAGRMDSLFFTSLQNATLRNDGYTLQADCCGLAVRRSFLKQSKLLFDVSAVRGMDTLMMTSLLSQGRQLRFVPDATIYHNHQVPLLRYLRKHFMVGYRAGRSDKYARALVAKKWNARTRRTDILRKLFANAPRQLGGYRALILALIAYSIKLQGRAAYALFGLKPGRHQVLNSPVNGVTSAELVARLVQAGERRTGLTATYLNAWSLIRAKRDSNFRKSLAEFDLCFAGGIGVAFTLFLTTLVRIKTVTPNDFCVPLFQEAANRGLKIALIGGKEGIAQAVARKMHLELPGLQIVFCASGYLNKAEEERVVNELRQCDPHIVIIGRGQPTQELWVQKFKSLLPNTVFLCVGGLFEYISSRVPSENSLLTKLAGIETWE